MIEFRPIITLQSIPINEGDAVSKQLLDQLNVWFHGKFRAIADPPIYDRGNTTIVRATHKVPFVRLTFCQVDVLSCIDL